MDAGLVSRVGLQLLLEPQSTAFLARGACLGVGALYPAYATYKALVVPKRAAAAAAPPRGGPSRTGSGSGSSAASVHGLEGERWLKYWALFGLTVVAERLLDAHLDRVPYYPHAKLAFLLWLQASQGLGAALLFDGYLVPWLCRYERKLDTILEAGATVAAYLYATYPIAHIKAAVSLGLSQLAAFIKWVSTPDDPLPPSGGVSGGGSSSSGGSGSSTKGHNLIVR